MTKNADVAGVFNCGTGVAETFNCVASAIVDYHSGGDIGYVQMLRTYTTRTKVILVRR